MSSHAAYSMVPSPGDWRELDLSILDTQRGPVPAVPLGHLAQPWAGWIGETQQATGAPADYILQSVLAGVAAVCGAAVRVRVTPAWDEPLVLWQAAVGEPSTGKSAALAPMRRMLEAVEQERRGGIEPSDQKAPQIVATDADPASLTEVVAGNPRGVLLWRDSPTAWLGDAEDDNERALWLAAWTADTATVARPRQPARSVARFPVSVLETIRPERLKASLRSSDDSLAARFLFAWPGPQPYRSLVAFKPSQDEEILQRLKALSRMAESADKPCELSFDANALGTLDGVSGSLHAEYLKAEGLEAAWLGKSRTFIARLAGALELLASVDGRGGRAGAIGSARVESAAKLWRDYYWPHARAVFDSAGLSDYERRVRRVGRWLRTTQPERVTREEIRRRALSQSVTADDVDQVLYRLHYLGFVQPDAADRDGPGRPANRWRVNPALLNVKNG